MLVIRPIEAIEDLKQVEAVQVDLWGDHIIPYVVLKAWQHAGGIVLGAFSDEKLIGFAAGFRGELDGKTILWSHQIGVMRGYQRQGIGRSLKFAQRDHALQAGIETIVWTFDPMRVQNAVFNIRTLGATAHKLYAEYYGPLDDEINRGLRSDRLEAWWNLNTERVIQRAENANVFSTNLPTDYALHMVEDKPRLNLSPNPDAVVYGVTVPKHIDRLRHDDTQTVLEWYDAIGQTLTFLFEADYEIRDIYQPEDQADRFIYCLSRGESWFIYILETNDNSYYIGITNRLDERIAAHNAGKGAKYTASRTPVRLLAAWLTYGRSKASKLEHQMKKLSRPQKTKLIETYENFQSAKRVR